jgi:large subunit ribosomal protein L30e
MPSLENELKNALRSGKVVVGKKESVRALKQGRGKVVVLASNAKPELKSQVKSLSNITRIPIIEFPGTSLELGYALGKPYPIQVMVVIDVGESRIMELAETAEVK